jgi:hypothetical protein
LSNNSGSGCKVTQKVTYFRLGGRDKFRRPAKALQCSEGYAFTVDLELMYGCTIYFKVTAVNQVYLSINASTLQ